MGYLQTQGNQGNDTPSEIHCEGKLWELSLDELASVGGGDISFNYGSIEVKYTQQKP